MAKAKATDAETAPPVVPDPPLTAVGAFEGDPVVWVRPLSGSDLIRCQVKDGKQRQIQIGGYPCEHVGEMPDGTWLYQMRAY